MTAAKRPRGQYRTGAYETGDASAFVSDGAQGFDVPEARYRMNGYDPAFDALPTKEEFDSNGGKLPEPSA